MKQYAAQRLEPLPPMPDRERDELAERVLHAAKLAFGDGLTAALGKGSAFKRDFVPHYSDFDVHLFVDPSKVHMLDARTPSLRHALQFQRALGKVEPQAYRVNSIQAYVVDASNYPQDWTPPLPGTYRVLYGTCPPLEMPSKDDLYQKSRSFFPWIRNEAPKLIGRILDKPDSGLAPYVRLLGTSLKPAVYHAATLNGADPLDVWTQPLGDLIPMLGDGQVEELFCRFFTEVREWEAVRHDGERLRTMLQDGLEGLERLCVVTNSK